MVFPKHHGSGKALQGNDDSTCELSSSTLNSALGDRSISDLGASLDLGRHVSTQRPTRELVLQAVRRGGEDLDDDFLEESFAIDTGDDLQPQGRLAASTSQLVTILQLDETDDNTETPDKPTKTQQQSNPTPIATAQRR
jgi:hypothetical protein